MKKSENKELLFSEVNKIRARLANVNKTQNEVADALNISRVTLSKFLNKESSHVTQNLVNRLKEQIDNYENENLQKS